MCARARARQDLDDSLIHSTNIIPFNDDVDVHDVDAACRGGDAKRFSWWSTKRRGKMCGDGDAGAAGR